MKELYDDVEVLRRVNREQKEKLDECEKVIKRLIDAAFEHDCASAKMDAIYEAIRKGRELLEKLRWEKPR